MSIVTNLDLTISPPSPASDLPLLLIWARCVSAHTLALRITDLSARKNGGLLSFVYSHLRTRARGRKETG